jgi:hypothetical protein
MGSRRVIDAEFEMRLMPGHPQGWTTFRGPDSAKAMTDFMRSFEGFRAGDEPFINAGGERVAVAVRERRRPRGGSAELDQRFGVLYLDKNPRRRLCRCRHRRIRRRGPRIRWSVAGHLQNLDAMAVEVVDVLQLSTAAPADAAGRVIKPTVEIWRGLAGRGV